MYQERKADNDEKMFPRIEKKWWKLEVERSKKWLEMELAFEDVEK